VEGASILDNNGIIGLKAGKQSFCNSKMSAEAVVAADEVCASCGIAAIDDVKLKLCGGGCDLVKYCGDHCQGNHREQHEDECKKRLTVLQDKQLFEQPDSSHVGECPLCFLPLSLDLSSSIMTTCCCKMICKGCDYANQTREMEQGLEHRCAFCREPLSRSDEEYDKREMKRIKQNDPVAICQMGKKHSAEGEYEKALEYYTKAAELGDVDAHACLGTLYYEGEGAEKDEEKAVYHYEQAAIEGHPGARILLALHEKENGRFERAAKHFIIAANLGSDFSLQEVKDFFIRGVVSKDDYAAALRGYQTAVNATKSAEREKAEAFYEATQASGRTFY
jgi:tetratricopeptide (TPR) repeat protein